MSSETPVINETLMEQNTENLPEAPSQKTVTYAGFWKRTLAFLLDYIVMMVLIIVFSFGMGMMMAHNGVDATADDTLALFDALMQLVVLMLGWLYFGVLESSKYQATLGKLLIGLKVTDIHGERLSFWRATGRHFGKYLSFLLVGIGFLMVAFTRRKQGLHDFMASCLVINNPH
ncbi:RDD family protein [Thiosulfativibrio zosterae]|uniref:RDD domain-containing protein n=1 Tax=Thiosulfativibrio zosterae TaxID=2675053 RepID=A0A6F8PL88_9GAMM|nr:RDD family protein [Thiosulfativibrio zosterae]BBP42760.1 hypothetical protein THMIRHAT_05060 [Thiosulfativibrio zosterae]